MVTPPTVLARRRSARRSSANQQGAHPLERGADLGVDPQRSDGQRACATFDRRVGAELDRANLAEPSGSCGSSRLEVERVHPHEDRTTIREQRRPTAAPSRRPGRSRTATSWPTIASARPTASVRVWLSTSRSVTASRAARSVPAASSDARIASSRRQRCSYSAIVAATSARADSSPSLRASS